MLILQLAYGERVICGELSLRLIDRRPPSKLVPVISWAQIGSLTVREFFGASCGEYRVNTVRFSNTVRLALQAPVAHRIERPDYDLGFRDMEITAQLVQELHTATAVAVAGGQKSFRIAGRSVITEYAGQLQAYMEKVFWKK